MHIFYTVILTLSAAVLVLASCAALRYVYPSLRMLYPDSPKRAPYGFGLSLLTIGFFLVTQMPAPHVAAGIGAVLFASYAMLNRLPLGAQAVAGVVVGLTAVFGYADAIKASPAPMMLALYGATILLPILSAPAAKSERGALMVLQVTLVAMIALAMAVLVFTNGVMVIGATDALLLAAPIAAALYYHHAKRAGAFGLIALMPLMVVVGFVVVTVVAKTSLVIGLISLLPIAGALVFAATLPEDS